MVVHSANWFYTQSAKINVWSLEKIIKKKISPSPYNPDFSYSVDDDEQLLEVYAIVGDSGILTINSSSHKFVAFHDFLENN